jgi:hypothetical protein
MRDCKFNKCSSSIGRSIIITNSYETDFINEKV